MSKIVQIIKKSSNTTILSHITFAYSVKFHGKNVKKKEFPYKLWNEVYALILEKSDS